MLSHILQSSLNLRETNSQPKRTTTGRVNDRHLQELAQFLDDYKKHYFQAYKPAIITDHQKTKRKLFSSFLKKKAPPLPPRISDARRRIEMQKQAKFHLARHDALMNQIRYSDHIHAIKERKRYQPPQRPTQIHAPPPTVMPYHIHIPQHQPQHQPRYSQLPHQPSRRPLPVTPPRRPDNRRHATHPPITPRLNFYKCSNRPTRSESFVYHC